MKIIKKGKPPMYDITCPCCKSVLRCKIAELDCVAWQFGKWIYSYTCPVCDTNNTIDDEKLMDGKVVGD